ncbi:hypothetical protein Tco_0079423 [Tanacetum coccineum]
MTKLRRERIGEAELVLAFVSGGGVACRHSPANPRMETPLWALAIDQYKVNDQTTQLRLLQTENTRITNGEGTSGGTNDKNGVGGTDDGGNGAFKVFDEMPILEKINQKGSVKEYYDVVMESNDVNEMIDISIGLMGIRVMSCDDKGVEDICEENVVGWGVIGNRCQQLLGVIVDEPMKGKVKNKSEVIVDEFVHNDGNSEDIEAIWKWFKRKNADSTCFKRKNRGWNRIVAPQWIWEDSEKMIILLIHMVSGVKRGLSDSKEKGLSNLKCFIQVKWVQMAWQEKDMWYILQKVSRNNKWKFDTWRWPKRKKVVIGCGLHQLDTLRDGNCEIIKLEETLIRVVSSCWLLIWMGRLKFSEYMLFQTLELSLNLMFSIEFEPSFQVWFMGRQQRLKIPFEKTMENKFEMVFKLLLEFASNIHRVHDINDTRLREIDAKIGDLGLEKRLKLVKKTYLGRDRRAHLLHFSLENLISGVQKTLVDSWVFGCIVWIRNIEVQFDVPKDEDQFESKVQLEPKCGPEPEHEIELMVINKELLNYPSSRPVLSIKLLEFRNKLEDKHGLKKERLIRAQLEVNTARLS